MAGFATLAGAGYVCTDSSSSNHIKACLVLNAQRAIYCSPDGRIAESLDPPRGGFVLTGPRPPPVKLPPLDSPSDRDAVPGV